IVENCFKHGDIDQNPEGHILIQIQIPADKQLHFRAENSVSEQALQNDHYQGIGLSNLKRRLELIYPDHYHLQIENKARIFAIELHLNELT
ncbi:MAG: sensor histidine kinase, partial [Bacteroidota bacterium]